jgi:hypothetical protein
MSDIAKILLEGLATSSQSPSNGGLRVADYPNPYGLRYGDNAIPKADGWIGAHKGKNGVMSEFSMSDERGFEYPSFVPGTTPENLKMLKKEVITPSQALLARQFADQQISKGESPFFDPFIEALKRLPK